MNTNMNTDTIRNKNTDMDFREHEHGNMDARVLRALTMVLGGACIRELVASSISRCKAAEDAAVRVVVTVRCLDKVASDRSTFSFTVADTGPAAKPEYFRSLLDGCTQSDQAAVRSPFTWDGILLVATSDACEKKIRSYQMTFGVDNSTLMLELPSKLKPKGFLRYRGTELSVKVEGNTEATLAFFRNLSQKMFILRLKGLSTEWHFHNSGGTESFFFPGSGPIPADELVLGSITYARKVLEISGNGSESLVEAGKGNSGSDTSGFLDACIVASRTSDMKDEATTEVIFYQDSLCRPVPELLVQALWKNVAWDKFGLSVKEILSDEDGTAVIHWKTLKPVRFHIVFLERRARSMKTNSRSQAKVVKEAVEEALCDLKARIPDMLASSRAEKMLSSVPDLSRCISGLVRLSSDATFRRECARIVGLPEAELDDKLESCLDHQMTATVRRMDKDTMLSLRKKNQP